MVVRAVVLVDGACVVAVVPCVCVWVPVTELVEGTGVEPDRVTAQASNPPAAGLIVVGENSLVR